MFSLRCNEEPKQLEVPLTEERGPGKRRRRSNTLYNAEVFWCHHDDEDPNCDPIT